ncbi:MAG TPA: hypothetical protein VE868_10950 [Balneolaceae bacterium]|nr:hypothetical protein [Balneolaceae bacterium]
MLVKSPLQKKDAKKNRRKSKRNKKRTSGSGGNANQKNHGRRSSEKGRKLPFFRIAPWKVIVGILVIGGLGILYLNHVFATKRLLNDVQKMQQQYKQAKRRHAKYRMKYDRMTGPTEITKKAKKMGFINGGPAKKIIRVKAQ